MFMGVAQIMLDDLDLSNIVIGWYKLFGTSSLVSVPPPNAPGGGPPGAPGGPPPPGGVPPGAGAPPGVAGSIVGGVGPGGVGKGSTHSLDSFG